jgi:hypothetical protein
MTDLLGHPIKLHRHCSQTVAADDALIRALMDMTKQALDRQRQGDNGRSAICCSATRATAAALNDSGKLLLSSHNE